VAPTTRSSRADTSLTAVPVAKEPRHRPVFRNSQVQVLDVVIPPGASTLFHTHVHDLAGITISSAPSRNEVQGEKPADKPEEPEGEAWFMPFPKPWTHRLTNLGTTDIHYVAFQLLQAPPRNSPGANAQAIPTGKVILEKPRIRIVRIDLAPGAESPEHSHRSGYGIVALTSGRVSQNGGPAELLSQGGFVAWREPSDRHDVRNSGDAPLPLFEIELPY
jgi:quercetin dioxygenase-like cupin family protein